MKIKPISHIQEQVSAIKAQKYNIPTNASIKLLNRYVNRRSSEAFTFYYLAHASWIYFYELQNRGAGDDLEDFDD